jgi:hypothetical protein
MKLRVPVMVQDPATARFEEVPALEHFDIDRKDVFLDGPVTRRLAVVDFDPSTGAVTQGVIFRPAPEGRALGAYQVASEDDLEAEDLLKVSVFGMALKTIYMFEEEDTLGRELLWAFGANQLLLVPRAGEWANAFYERSSHSIQFFSFKAGGATVHTALSRDIVAHETGHAVLDGIAPDLYNATTPQSLALHEAMADMTALTMAFRSHTLRNSVLARTKGSIRQSSAFASIAEEFGLAVGRPGSLRDLLNDFSLDPQAEQYVAHDEPHELSQVLSGALYSVMVRLHEQLIQEQRAAGLEALPAAGKALGLAERRLKRMMFRALDYLPPGDVTFADYGRALIAADQASHPGPSPEREWICEEFTRRAIVHDKAALDVTTNFEHPGLAGTDLETLVSSDWAAYTFADANRELLGIPPDVPFRVRPRLDVTKLFYHRDQPERVRECIFKVSWEQREPNPFGAALPPLRSLTVGTTLAIDWDSHHVRCCLTAAAGQQPDAFPWLEEEQSSQHTARTALLRKMLQADTLQLGDFARTPEGEIRPSIIHAETIDGVMRVRGTARMLHIARGVS